MLFPFFSIIYKVIQFKRLSFVEVNTLKMAPYVFTYFLKMHKSLHSRDLQFLWIWLLRPYIVLDFYVHSFPKKILISSVVKSNSYILRYIRFLLDVKACQLWTVADAVLSRLVLWPLWMPDGKLLLWWTPRTFLLSSILLRVFIVWNVCMKQLFQLPDSGYHVWQAYLYRENYFPMQLQALQQLQTTSFCWQGEIRLHSFPWISFSSIESNSSLEENNLIEAVLFNFRKYAPSFYILQQRHFKKMLSRLTLSSNLKVNLQRILLKNHPIFKKWQGWLQLVPFFKTLSQCWDPRWVHFLICTLLPKRSSIEQIRLFKIMRQAWLNAQKQVVASYEKEWIIFLLSDTRNRLNLFRLNSSNLDIDLTSHIPLHLLFSTKALYVFIILIAFLSFSHLSFFKPTLPFMFRLLILRQRSWDPFSFTTAVSLNITGFFDSSFQLFNSISQKFEHKNIISFLWRSNNEFLVKIAYNYYNQIGYLSQVDLVSNIDKFLVEHTLFNVFLFVSLQGSIYSSSQLYRHPLLLQKLFLSEGNILRSTSDNIYLQYPHIYFISMWLI